MNLIRTLVPAIITGVSGFIIFGVIATEIASPYIEFSVFVGIPVGLIAGLVLTALVIATLGTDDPAKRRSGASVASFGIAFLVVALLVAGILRLRISLSLIIGGVAGIIGAVATYVRLWEMY